MTDRLVLLSHAGTDLSALARAELPAEFAQVLGINLQAIENTAAMQTLLQDELATARVILVRVLGHTDGIAGFDLLLRHARQTQAALIVLSGTGEPDPALAALSNVPAGLQQEVNAYLQAGGTGNLAQMLRCLSDRLLMTGHGYTEPQSLPEHGIYHPELGALATLDDWRAMRRPDWPTVGLVFYRAHWLSGNTHFIDSLIDALAEHRLNALPVFTASLRAPGEHGLPAALAPFAKEAIETLINTTSFAIGEVNSDGPTQAGWAVAAFEQLNVPVLQAIASNMTEATWRAADRGLNPLDTAMNVALPEFDGRLITVPMSFKAMHAEAADGETVYMPLADRVRRVAGIAARQVRLRTTPPAEKRIAFLFTNSSSKAAQIGNAVGLDSPASLWAILQAMQTQGYRVDGLPTDSTTLMHQLIDRGAYDQAYLTDEQLARAAARVPAARYAEWFAELPHGLQARMTERWGDAPGVAYVHQGALVFSGLEFGNAFVALQPPRGYGMDPDAIYHTPDLAPTHHYYALYCWLRDEWQADAIVHVGKHGTLEWLPGKGVGLSQDCFPDAVLGDMPLFYPFILNDPGEGAQAKRRAHATIIDHLTPPMTTADTYGPLAQLTQLVDEYYQVEMLDPSKLPILQQQIWDLIKEAKLDADLGAMLAHGHDHEPPKPAAAASGYRTPVKGAAHYRPSVGKAAHGAHHHSHGHGHDHDHHHWDDTPDEHGVPRTLTQMEGVDVAHLIEDIDGYLCELGAAQIRDGLHTLGRAPEGDALIDMLCALTRLSNLQIPSLPASVAALFELDLAQLEQQRGARLPAEPARLAALTDRRLVTHADAIDAVALLARRLVAAFAARDFAADAIDQVLATTLPGLTVGPALRTVLGWIGRQLVPDLARTRAEIDNLLSGLAGGYVPAGPSGAPTRGMAHVLPTGRNFYSVDPRSLPSQASWRIGSELAREVVARHRQETGAFPESVSISVWGTSAMRTHGDDIAEILALLGVRPVWQAESRRVQGIEVIPLADLGRPRIDVTVRISGFFRDAFPHLISLIDQAVEAVAGLDEPVEQNFLRKHYLQDLKQQILGEHTESQSLLRVFGSKPGTYGAGILPLIQQQNWQDEHDFATAYINWGGYGYSRQHNGSDARDALRHRLASSEVALHNQDNREHDIFDSDDYLQYHGGMIATIRSLSGRQPRQEFGDSHQPDNPAVRGLKQEVLRVFRSRVVNPKWLTSIQKHGYKGGLELTATVDYLFGYDATAHVVDDWVYQALAEHYALDTEMQRFLADNNPWAMNAITERLLEAAERQLWAEPDAETLAKLRALHLKSEAWLEARGE
ncbi:cobaltochelatase subunit CobN [Paludibacterium purpuratum]|uniref:Cobaltochelatase CobN subunit n=1 Tax=Paludibacterium purpuratum TaxID=1144873 RepID=A0A4R7B585_9NEIS|nr:cobaltochelatase subunit CobN [Paludibacterium purpuratum]TDR79824.1 cobaltochelatase CobN subunit [Paludibacterium purpuratum]